VSQKIPPKENGAKARATLIAANCADTPDPATSKSRDNVAPELKKLRATINCSAEWTSDKKTLPTAVSVAAANARWGVPARGTKVLRESCR